MNLSGRGDKDVAQAADKIGLQMPYEGPFNLLIPRNRILLTRKMKPVLRC